MNISLHVKWLLSSFYDNSGLVKSILKYLSKDHYLMLMYHRVVPYKKAIPGLQAGMYVEPETFDMHLHYLNKFFFVIPFSELHSITKDKSLIKRNKPLCIITFDDGWYDFYRYAFPILKERRVAATVFLPTKYIGTEEQFWTDRFANLILQKRHNNKDIKYNQNIKNKDVVETIDHLEGPIDSIIERAISLLKKYSDEDISIILDILANHWDVDSNLSERSFLKWGEVGEMKESGIINFGSHTNSHKMLTYLHDHEIMEELIQSKNKLISQKVVDTAFIPFSYPNGNYDERVIPMVREAGYHAAATTDIGWNNRNTPLFRLNRVSIHQDISSTKAMYGCRICNLI